METGLSPATLFGFADADRYDKCLQSTDEPTRSATAPIVRTFGGRQVLVLEDLGRAATAPEPGPVAASREKFEAD